MMTNGHHTLQGAAKAYLTEYQPLLEWIMATLWDNPKPRQATEKADLSDIRRMLGEMAGGRRQNINAADFGAVISVLNSAAYDSTRSSCPPFANLPPNKTIEDYIHQARDDLLDHLVNSSFVAATPAAAATIATKRLRDGVKTFCDKHHRALDYAASSLRKNGASLFVEECIEPLLMGLQTIKDGRYDRYDDQHARAMQQARMLLPMMRMTAEHIMVPPASGNVLIALEKAEKDYKDNLQPLIDQIEQSHNGLSALLTSASPMRQP